MKKSCIIIFVFLAPIILPAQDAVTARLNALMEAYNKVDKFNGSILVARKGKVLLEKGYGYRDVKLKINNDQNSIYPIYSITKTFTSTVILMLVEQGKLSLQDKLGKFYPEYPRGDSITIEHLLTHTSGVYDYTQGNDMKEQNEQSMIRFLESKPLDFSPGSDWRYSNSGYWLLGFIIQKVTGMTYEQAVAKMIFMPLKMAHSGFAYKFLKSPQKTTPYEWLGSDSAAVAIVYDPPGPYAAGGIYSTAGDLLIYHKAHQRYILVSESMMKKAYTSFKQNYGYGWVLGRYHDRDIVSHSGGGAGYRTNFTRIINDDIVVILLCNAENNNPQIITNNVLDLLLNKPYYIPKEIKLSRELLQNYTGYFATGGNLNLHVIYEQGRLMAQASGQGPTMLLAEKDNYFYSEEARGYIEYIKSNNGQYDSLNILQSGRIMPAQRFVPSWGLIGSATAKGWGQEMPDIPMKEDNLHKGYWSVSNITLKEGEVKFRFNNDWNFNYGDDGDDDKADLHGKNIKVAAGNYDIILDITDKNMVRYTIRKLQ